MKPRICELLGVELNEEFSFFDDIYRIVPVYTPIMENLFEESGKKACVGYNLQHKRQNTWCNDCTTGAMDVIELLDHADLIKRNENMNKNIPNICKVLNVQPLEEFKYNCKTYRIADDGWPEIKTDDGDFCEIENLTYSRECLIDLICMINYPPERREP